MPVALVSDTCHYLPRQLADAIGLREVSLYVHDSAGARPEREVADYEAFYARLAAGGELPTTSQPSIGDFLAVYEPLLAAGHEIVSIHLSGGLSGTVRSAEQARAQLGEAGALVHVVDSATACGAQGLMLLAAAAAAGAGADAAAVVARAQAARASLDFLFALDTLEYLRRGGRVGGAQALLGSALRIKPILSLDSQITAVERVRTSRRAFERLVALGEQLAASGRDGWVVQHAHAPEAAGELVARCGEVFGCEPVFVSEIGPVIGAHIGPGLLGIGATDRTLLE
jgi:DegV family protein with EDD domain